ncbi:hypothetical protein BKH21_13500 [Actinomyces oris]|uniref:4'-phosphopantetheinyl transferase family protein n=1 Tax=Actinomyces oris TaxID=544580 RepID=UPI00094D4AD4|nr:4'-phosphopantetheinyl transferase superfamily protein [Actinomyces oris]OLO64327.1 hypothetical protein BKH21_13500 [Actinomyces oris]
MGSRSHNAVILTEVQHYMYDPLYPEEYEYLQFASDKRCCEFITARHCARVSLEKLGLQRPVMVPGDHGEPVWPDGVVGSITHCQDYCAAAVAMSCDIAAIGIDAEQNEPLSDDILAIIASEDERMHVCSSQKCRPDVALDRLLFCIKECAYKAWFSLTKTPLSFYEIFASIDGCGQFKIALPNYLVEGEEVSYGGTWRKEGGVVMAELAIVSGG